MTSEYVDNSQLMFDFNAIEELDPSLADGCTAIYDREVNMEIRNKIGAEEVLQGTMESIKVKMLLQGSEESPSAIRVELSSEADLFFHYVHVIDGDGYRSVQNQQKLMVDFADYPNVLIRMLNLCIREPHTHMTIFMMQGDSNSARLDFIQNMEYKFIELMSCVFERSSQETVQHHITYRYNVIKQRLALMQTRLHDINNLVKTKNPSLLLQLQKTPGVGSNSAFSGKSGSSVGSITNSSNMLPQSALQGQWR